MCPDEPDDWDYYYGGAGCYSFASNQLGFSLAQAVANCTSVTPWVPQ
ncbi:MAG: hypothetical protein LBR29_08470 [Methylobacteriaceae bacterium]|nr:hypothetical protein [Methylobacteriaceae bacterium]